MEPIEQLCPHCAGLTATEMSYNQQLQKQLAELQAREARLITIMRLMETNIMPDREGDRIFNITQSELEAVGIHYESKNKYCYEVPVEGFVDLALTPSPMSDALKQLGRVTLAAIQDISGGPSYEYADLEDSVLALTGDAIDLAALLAKGNTDG
jgi:hypothetical protein